jgi:AmmeMemoRadiSam system protein B/AmmeMemoRadiSam system protein A
MNTLFGSNSHSLRGTRLPYFAGTWYSANGSELERQIDSCLDTAAKQLEIRSVDSALGENAPADNSILAMIVPHAGYAFSGQTAAYAYEKLKALPIKRVFLLGPSHYTAFHGVALPSQAIFETPLGALKVDKDVIEQLAQFSYFRTIEMVHDHEHSLEMQLPFLRKVFGEVPIVPLVVGSFNKAEEIKTVAQVLKRYLTDGDVVIVSSDFTHYGPRFEFEPFKEFRSAPEIAEKIKDLDKQAFQCLQQTDLESFLDFKQRTNDTICGFYPCALLLAMLPPGCHATLLKYETSQQIVYDPAPNSVSYLALLFSNSETKELWTVPSSGALLSRFSEEDGVTLLKIARRAVEANLHSDKLVYADLLTPTQAEKFNHPAGAFVTLYLNLGKGQVLPSVSKGKDTQRRSADKKLRGCIGYIYPIKSLIDCVVESAVNAANNDPRFTPLQSPELDQLEIEVSVLSPPAPIKSWQEIRLGIDGVIMHKNGQKAVFLPCVATEFGWELPELLSQLSLKAGCGANGWKQGAFFEVFQARVF